MFLQRIERPRTKKDGTISQQPEVRYQFQCDACKKIYEKRPGNVSVSRSGLHFCSNACKFEAHRAGKILRVVSERTSLERYSSTTPMSSPIVIAKWLGTFKERYGEDVTSPLQVPGAKERRARTHLERYGVEHTFQVEAFKQKRNVTWQRNMPQNFISKSELKFKIALEERFGKDDIIHQRWVNGHPIDFYVKSIDTYVQFDGVYWHGLNRPIDVIQTSTSVRDKTIFKHWLNDREQDTWFAEKGLRLVRITDVQDANEAIKLL